jgi:hypothetical protein
MSRPTLLSLFGAALCLASLPAQSGIVKCKSSSGEITYTQNTCPPGTSPLDLPEGVTPDTGSSLRGATRMRKLSPEAEAVSKLPMREYGALYRKCLDRSNWALPDCGALREEMAAKSEYSESRSIEDSNKSRAICSKGNREFCVDAACEHYVFVGNQVDPLTSHLGTDNDVRACSRALNLPSTTEWAQVVSTDAGAGGRFSAGFVCLHKFEFLNGLGQRMERRSTVKVVAVEGGYRFTTLKSPVFKTVAEAATEGCREFNRRAAAGQIL